MGERYLRIAAAAAQTSGATTTQDITIPGEARTPSGAIVELFGATSVDSITQDVVYARGITDGSTHCVVSRSIQDGTSTSNVQGFASDPEAIGGTENYILATMDPSAATAALDGYATFDSFLPGGMRIDWGDYPPSAYLIRATLVFSDKVEVIKGTIPGGTVAYGNAEHPTAGGWVPSLVFSLYWDNWEGGFDGLPNNEDEWGIAVAAYCGLRNVALPEGSGFGYDQTSIAFQEDHAAATTANQLRIRQTGIMRRRDGGNDSMRALQPLYEHGKTSGIEWLADFGTNLSDAEIFSLCVGLPMDVPMGVYGGRLLPDEIYNFQWSAAWGASGDTSFPFFSRMQQVNGICQDNARLDNTVSDPFGGTAPSLLLDGTNDRFYLDGDAWTNLTTHNASHRVFEMGALIRFSSTSGIQTIMGHWNASARIWKFTYDGDAGRLEVWQNDGTYATGMVIKSEPWLPAADTWYEVLATRDSNDDVRLFVGVPGGLATELGTATQATSFYNLDSWRVAFRVGARQDGLEGFNGRIYSVWMTSNAADSALIPTTSAYTIPSADRFPRPRTQTFHTDGYAPVFLSGWNHNHYEEGGSGDSHDRYSLFAAEKGGETYTFEVERDDNVATDHTNEIEFRAGGFFGGDLSGSNLVWNDDGVDLDVASYAHPHHGMLWVGDRLTAFDWPEHVYDDPIRFNAGSPSPVNFTCPVGCSKLVLVVTGESTAAAITQAWTFNGASMVLAARETAGSSGFRQYAEIWYIDDPDVGSAYSLSPTLDAAVTDGCFSVMAFPLFNTKTGMRTSWGANSVASVARLEVASMAVATDDILVGCFSGQNNDVNSYDWDNQMHQSTRMPCSTTGANGNAAIKLIRDPTPTTWGVSYTTARNRQALAFVAFERSAISTIEESFALGARSSASAVAQSHTEAALAVAARTSASMDAQSFVHVALSVAAQAGLVPQRGVITNAQLALILQKGLSAIGGQSREAAIELATQLQHVAAGSLLIDLALTVAASAAHAAEGRVDVQPSLDLHALVGQSVHGPVALELDVTVAAGTVLQSLAGLSFADQIVVAARLGQAVLGALTSPDVLIDVEVGERVVTVRGARPAIEVEASGTSVETDTGARTIIIDSK